MGTQEKTTTAGGALAALITKATAELDQGFTGPGLDNCDLIAAARGELAELQAAQVLEVNGWIKHWEVDDFENGCNPDLCGNIFGEDVFRAEDQAELIKKLMAFVGCDDPDAVLINACEEPGRIDIQQLETDQQPPSVRQLEAWKAGDQVLFLADYSFQVQAVTRAPAVLTDPAEQVIS